MKYDYIPLIEKIDDVLIESTDKDLYFTGPFIVMDKRNRNGRIYSMERTIPIVNAHIEDYLKKNKSVGELDHPEDIAEIPKIHMDNITHRNVSLELVGNIFYGKALIADTPKGLVVKGLHAAGIVLGASSRATGKVDKSTGIVLPGMKLVTPADIVWNPSAEEAVLDAIYESEQFIKPLFDEAMIARLRTLLKDRANKNLVNSIISTHIRQ
jgi:hypothetical protein